MGNIANGELNTFVDGQIVSANDATYGLNPKMEVIRVAVNDNDSRIAVLEGQVGSLNAIVYNVKSSPYNAVGDGVADDTAAIQAAISAAAASNGEVVFPNGNYKISNTISITGSCLIRSNGSGYGVTITQSVADKGAFSVQSSNVRISGITFTLSYTSASGYTAFIKTSGSSASSYYDNVVIDSCVFSTSTFYNNSLEIAFSSNVLVYNCTFTNTNASASASILLYSCSNVVLENNYGSGFLGFIVLNRYTTGLDPVCNNVAIINNKSSSMTSSFVSIVGASNCYIRDNTISQSAGFYSISAGSSGSIIPTNIQVTGNVINNSSATVGSVTAVYFQQVSGGLIEENYIKESGTQTGAINITSSSSSVIVAKNRLENCYGYGVSISGSSSGISVSNNIFTDMYYTSATTIYGTAVYYSSSGSNNEITSNKVVVGTKTATAKNVNGLFTNVVSNPILFFNNNFSSCSYTMNSVNSMNLLLYHIDSTLRLNYYTTSTSAPTTGTYLTGTRVLLTTPQAGGYIGYVCVSGGSPGTWKGFGAIQA